MMPYPTVRAFEGRYTEPFNEGRFLPDYEGVVFVLHRKHAEPALTWKDAQGRHFLPIPEEAALRELAGGETHDLPCLRQP